MHREFTLRWTLLLSLPLSLILVASAQAASDEERFPFIESDPTVSTRLAPQGLRPWAALDARELYRRQESVLNHFGAPAEGDVVPQLRELKGLGTAERIRARLPFFDAKRQFERFYTIDAGAPELRGYLDRDARAELDFALPLRSTAAEGQPEDFLRRIMNVARGAPAQRPLEGLRIALDPGHMGGDPWDQRTGKWVRDRRTNRKLSEGVLAMQTAVLLARELEALGARTMITRSGIRPATDLTWDRLDVREYARRELRFHALQDWFQELLRAAAPDASIFTAFERHPRFQQLFAEGSRSHFFIFREDLETRARKIEAFRPDLTYVLHYDVVPPQGDPNGVNPAGYNRTKVYVPGAFLEPELATRVDRRSMAAHLAGPDAWDASVRLSQQVVAAAGAHLGIEPDPSGGPGDPIRVAPGVYSRNLLLTRRLTGHAVAYLETLYYNGAAEFARLSQEKHPLTIDGRNYPYSDRLAQVVRALRDATTAFVASYR